MDKRFFEKRCKFSIRKFTLGVASVMIGATFFAASPVLADQARVGSTDNLPSELADLDKKASDEGTILTRKLPLRILVQLKLLKALKQRKSY